MEPNHNSFNGASELPQPQEVPSGMPKEHMSAAPEHAPSPQPSSPQPGAPMQAVPSTPQYTPPMPDPAAMVSPVVGGAIGQQLIADDTDLIEKEWVIKAKAIVAHTKDDPYRQNEEMTKMKADYLKTRYNKDLKGSEG